MPNRLNTPNPQFIGNDGLPLAGAFLYFYATGTDTPLDTYSDPDLDVSHANPNPIELDSDGYAGPVFLQNLAYKVVLENSDLTQIWTEDPVYSSDYSTFAQFKPWNGNPNGAVAGTAGTQGALPGSSAIWDYLDNILYVATTTGDATTTVWTAVNASAATPATPAPQGYLTLSSDASNPILTADAISQTAVYYTPYVGNLVPVYNGSSFITTAFTQLTLTLSASNALSTAYDVFVFNNSGVLTLVTGPAWSNSAAGTGSRSTGAGTTQLQRLNGLWVNAVQINGRNGATSYVIDANTATYLGSILIDTTAGQVTCHRSWGQSRVWGVWNCYNRSLIYLKAGDSTASWSYGGATIRASNNNAANSLQVFSGLPEEYYDIKFNQMLDATSGATSVQGSSLIGFNSVVASSGYFANNSSVGGFFPGIAEYFAVPSLGMNRITCLETLTSGSANISFFGTETKMVLSAQYRG